MSVASSTTCGPHTCRTTSAGSPRPQDPLIYKPPKRKLNGSHGAPRFRGDRSAREHASHEILAEKNGCGGGRRGRQRDEPVQHGARVLRGGRSPELAGMRRRRRRRQRRRGVRRRRRVQGVLEGAALAAQRSAGQDELGGEQDPSGRGGGHQADARGGRRLLLREPRGGRRRRLPELHATVSRRAAARRRVQQRDLQVQMAALTGHSFRGAQLRGRGGADQERQGGAGGDRAQLPRRVRDGARRRGVQGAGGRAAGGVRRAGGAAARRGAGHVRRGEAERAGKQHAHGALEEAAVHGSQVARHAGAGCAPQRRRRRRRGGGRVAGDNEQADAAAQVQGVHAHARLRRPDRRGGRVS